ncbi:hypothetical protein P170DRAFT_389841 [Aspergillus steynii IBT 23096]|uniref:Regulator of rDNA transcription protein 8 n=1 Tax=Aspergillus steynii IBT 23096 TaxID=1392250 RepID=A0A2I2FYM0_9EURO|nr:uncharacterized protein P170DRAFT_389841 [Aspergillus steynii IBT 23096]PLB45727.1 hypothetical protein P170DRAFT_389841 [Aspergillus steynii IBT 23096]
MATQLRNFILAEIQKFRSTAKDVVTSRTWWYPIQGLLYLSTHEPLRRPFLSRLGQTVTLGVGITSGMFFFTYLPQTALLALTNGPWAPISAAFLVVSESASLTTLVARCFSLRDSLTDTFDATLLAKNADSLVAEGRNIQPPSRGHDVVARLGNLVKQPVESLRPEAALRAALLLPLNLVPVVGTAVYVWLQGQSAGPRAHARYFQLKGWDEKRAKEWVRGHRPGYTGFGVAAVALEMVPFLSLAFAFSNTVGAALWAADLESEERSDS